MPPIYLFHRDPDAPRWLVSRVSDGESEALFSCPSATEARALARALRTLTGNDAKAKRDAFRKLGLMNGLAATAAPA